MIKDKTENVIAFDALKAAIKAGNKNCVNVIMLGALSSMLPFSTSAWEEAIRKRVPAKFLEVNMKAFKAGIAFTNKEGKKFSDNATV